MSQKKLLYFRKWNFVAPPPKKKKTNKQTLNKTFLYSFLYSNKTPFGETGCLSNLNCFLTAQASSLLIHLTFQKTVSQATFGTLPLNVQYLCDLKLVSAIHFLSNLYFFTK